MMSEAQKVNQLLREARQALRCDVLVYNGDMRQDAVDRATNDIVSRNRAENVLLVLTTYGGDPDAAYVLARSLQRHYRRFIAYVPGYCQSAGTLVVLGAHDLYLSPHAQLGPLDIQVSHGAEIGEQLSGLAPSEALRVLETRARDFYRKSFEDLRFRLRMPTKLAASTAASFVSGIYRDSFRQVDPIRLGEMDRANRIAVQYGERLVKRGRNVKDGTLLKLVGTYPSHEFVIDVEEAQDLFNSVGTPPPLVDSIGRWLGTRRPIKRNDVLAVFIEDSEDDVGREKKKEQKEEDDGTELQGAREESDGATRRSRAPEERADGDNKRPPVDGPIRDGGGGNATQEPAA